MARKLEVELNAKSNADVVFGRAQRAASKFAGEIGNRVMGAVAPMVLFDKGMNLMTGAMDKYADANARARKLGVPFSEFFQLSEALDDAGISEETTAKAVKEMTIVLAEAQGGVETQVKALKDLGFTQEQISKGSINVIDLFMKLADATKSARSEAERNNVVLTILGKKTGPELANALSAGSSELRKAWPGLLTRRTTWANAPRIRAASFVTWATKPTAWSCASISSWRKALPTVTDGLPSMRP